MTRWRHLLAIDSDPRAVACYEANVGPAVCAVVGPGSVERLAPGVRPDVVLGGPPCQPFSSAGSHGGGLGAAGWSGRFAGLPTAFPGPA